MQFLPIPILYASMRCLSPLSLLQRAPRVDSIYHIPAHPCASYLRAHVLDLLQHIVRCTCAWLDESTRSSKLPIQPIFNPVRCQSGSTPCSRFSTGTTQFQSIISQFISIAECYHPIPPGSSHFHFDSTRFMLFSAQFNLFKPFLAIFRLPLSGKTNPWVLGHTVPFNQPNVFNLINGFSARSIHSIGPRVLGQTNPFNWPTGFGPD
jgi:hypothetical protein